MMRVVLLAACSANVVAFLQRPANQADGSTGADGHADERARSNDAPTSRSLLFATVPQKTTYACVDIGFPDDPGFKCADEAEACNDTSDPEWYHELRYVCAKTCGVCGGASTPPAAAPVSSPPPPSSSTPLVVSSPPPPSAVPCVDIGFPDDPDLSLIHI